MRKKLTACAFALTLCLSALIAAGCGGDSNTSTTGAGSSETTAAASTADEGFYFELEGQKLTPGMAQDDMISAIGETDNVFSAPSCAGQGTDYTYTYGSVEIVTVPNADGVNEISTIALRDDLTSTPEGVSLYMTTADMTAAYGEDYTQSGNAYTYVKGNVKLSFIIENDEITSIEYSLATA